MKNFKFTVTDPSGMHARPVGMLVKACMPFASTITVQKDEKTADAKRLFALMGLGVKQNEEITITIEGTDEDTAFNELQTFCNENL